LYERGRYAEAAPLSERALVISEQALGRDHLHGIFSTRGAYILFPGDGVGMRMEGKTQNFFIRHPSAFRGPAAHNFPSVGAFDLCPGRDETQLPVLKAFLSAVLEAFATGNPYQEEQGLFE